MQNRMPKRRRFGRDAHLAGALAWGLACACTDTPSPVTGSSDPATDSAPDAGGPAVGPGGGGTSDNGSFDPGTEIDTSFIWVANSQQGTVSKIDTRTLTELGRYLTSPLGKGKPSRTSVALDGSVAVANRGGTYTEPSVEAGLTKLFASPKDCIDRNKNGKIDTSTGKGDIRPWLEDECLAWHAPLAYWSNRPVAWAPKKDRTSTEPALVWTAASTQCSSDVCNFDVLRLNGDTGEVQDVVHIGPLEGPDFITGPLTGGVGGGVGIPGLPTFPGLPGAGGGLSILHNYGPYGGASDAGGNFWVFTATTTHLIRVDAKTLAWKSWKVPDANGYGITVDPKGRVFVCGTQGISRFDPATSQWLASSAGPALGYNGCMVDGKSTIWVGGGGDGGELGLHAFDIDTLALIESFPVGAVKGVSIDIEGFVWGVSGGNVSGMAVGDTAYRLDPKTGDVKSYAGLTGAYSYSDMTGFGLKQAGVIEVF